MRLSNCWIPLILFLNPFAHCFNSTYLTKSITIPFYSYHSHRCRFSTQLIIYWVKFLWGLAVLRVEFTRLTQQFEISPRYWSGCTWVDSSKWRTGVRYTFRLLNLILFKFRCFLIRGVISLKRRRLLLKGLFSFYWEFSGTDHFIVRLLKFLHFVDIAFMGLLNLLLYLCIKCICPVCLFIGFR